MANFAKLTVIDMGNEPNKAITESQTAGIIGTTAASNGAGTPVYGVHCKLKERHDKYLILVQHNTPGDGGATVNCVLKGGNSGKWGGKDLAFSVAKNKAVLLKIEAGPYKNETPNAAMKALAGYTSSDTEDMKGDIVITASSAQVSIAVIKESF